MKYKIGDKVKVRSDLEVGNVYGNIMFTQGMDYLKGKKAYIIATTDKNLYRISNDVVGYLLSEEMFEELGI